ncbi:MAG: hypothetical protein COA33_001115 [Fluviicola sp.]|nr:hypothetical protein [Fluviicola sp.]
MKNNLENSIKESLKNFEAPYNSAAWTAMSSKLDAKMPTSSTGGSIKWIAAASVVVVALFAAYYAVNNKNTEETSVKVAEKSSESKENVIETKNTKNTNNVATEFSEQKDNPATAPTVTPSNENDKDEQTVNNSTSSDDITTATTNSENITTNQAGPIGSGIEIDEITSISTPTAILPRMTNVCAGESVTIKNTNDIALELVGPGLNKMIAANSTMKIQLKNAGSYQVFAENSSSHTDFEVKRLPNVDFIIDNDNKFDKGLPTTKLISTVGNNLTWSINDKKFNGKEVDLHMFNRGAYNITLTEKGMNGCSNSVRKQLFNEEKYNLMAMDAFIPSDIDPRNNTFMPFALTEREVKFTMIIIDPTDGHVVYQTMDSSQGWDGIDAKTGRLVKFERTYIWKVVLENPERGEKNEYAGNIIPITL